MISKLLKLGATLKTEFAPYAKYDQTWQNSFSRQIEKGDKHPPVLVWLKKDNQKNTPESLSVKRIIDRHKRDLVPTPAHLL